MRILPSSLTFLWGMFPQPQVLQQLPLQFVHQTCFVLIDQGWYWWSPYYTCTWDKGREPGLRGRGGAKALPVLHTFCIKHMEFILTTPTCPPKLYRFKPGGGGEGGEGTCTYVGVPTCIPLQGISSWWMKPKEVCIIYWQISAHMSLLEKLTTPICISSPPLWETHNLVYALHINQKV